MTEPNYSWWIVVTGESITWVKETRIYHVTYLMTCHIYLPRRVTPKVINYYNIWNRRCCTDELCGIKIVLRDRGHRHSLSEISEKSKWKGIFISFLFFLSKSRYKLEKLLKQIVGKQTSVVGQSQSFAGWGWGLCSLFYLVDLSSFLLCCRKKKKKWRQRWFTKCSRLRLFPFPPPHPQRSLLCSGNFMSTSSYPIYIYIYMYVFVLKWMIVWI